MIFSYSLSYYILDPMLSISHAATGAFIAVHVGNPVVAVPLILLSHYLEDAVPHWDAGTGLSSGKKTRKSAIIHGIIDLFVAGVVVLLFYPPDQSSPLAFLSAAPIWGAFLGLLPDFLESPRNFMKYEPALLRPLNRFHHSFHHSIPRALDGLAPQIILLIGLWFFR